MDLEDALKEVEKWNLKKPEPLNPSKMTNEELARLRFTSVSSSEEEVVMKELKKRGFAL